MHAYIHM
jgi:hypothetical protein